MILEVLYSFQLKSILFVNFFSVPADDSVHLPLVPYDTNCFQNMKASFFVNEMKPSFFDVLYPFKNY